MIPRRSEWVSKWVRESRIRNPSLGASRENEILDRFRLFSSFQSGLYARSFVLAVFALQPAKEAYTTETGGLEQRNNIKLASYIEEVWLKFHKHKSGEVRWCAVLWVFVLFFFFLLRAQKYQRAAVRAIRAIPPMVFVMLMT
jgi:hypothetical protein